MNSDGRLNVVPSTKRQARKKLSAELDLSRTTHCLKKGASRASALQRQIQAPKQHLVFRVASHSRWLTAMVQSMHRLCDLRSESRTHLLVECKYADAGKLAQSCTLISRASLHKLTQTFTRSLSKRCPHACLHTVAQ